MSEEDWSHFYEVLQEISDHVDKWPQWKKEGWYILDYKEDK